MQQYSYNNPPFSAVSLHMYIAGSYFVLLCFFAGRLPWCVSHCAYSIQSFRAQGVLKISSDEDDQMEPKVKTPKNP